MRPFWNALQVCLCIIFFSAVYLVYVAEDGGGMILWAADTVGFIPGQLLVGIGMTTVFATPLVWVMGSNLQAFLWTAAGIPLGLALMVVGSLNSIF